jgi:hypothetical protein
MSVAAHRYEIGCPIEGASKGLQRLIEVGFCTFDEPTKTVWVHEMARYQIGESLKPKDKRQIHIQRIFAAIENPLIQQGFFDKYGAAYQLTMPLRTVKKDSPTEGASKPQAAPSEAKINIKVNSSAPTERTPAASSDPDKELFDRGKQILGKSAGGQIARLKPPREATSLSRVQRSSRPPRSRTRANTSLA